MSKDTPQPSDIIFYSSPELDKTATPRKIRAVQTKQKKNVVSPARQLIFNN